MEISLVVSVMNCATGILTDMPSLDATKTQTLQDISFVSVTQTSGVTLFNVKFH
jgi:hypothetical protein